MGTKNKASKPNSIANYSLDNTTQAATTGGQEERATVNVKSSQAGATKKREEQHCHQHTFLSTTLLKKSCKGVETCRLALFCYWKLVYADSIKGTHS